MSVYSCSWSVWVRTSNEVDMKLWSKNDWFFFPEWQFKVLICKCVHENARIFFQDNRTDPKSSVLLKWPGPEAPKNKYHNISWLVKKMILKFICPPWSNCVIKKCCFCSVYTSFLSLGNLQSVLNIYSHFFKKRY